MAAIIFDMISLLVRSTLSLPHLAILLQRHGLVVGYCRGAAGLDLPCVMTLLLFICLDITSLS